MEHVTGILLRNTYEIRKHIGQGSMWLVYEAFDRNVHRQVVIKVIKPNLGMLESQRQAFMQEARVVAALNHQHILRVYVLDEEVVDNHTLSYLVMDFADKGTLADRLAELKQANPTQIPLMPLAELRTTFSQVCQAVAYAHQNNIIHLDLKPSNILFDADGKALVSDFGLAKLLQDTTHVKAETHVGTPRYMPPEQFLGNAVGAPSDVYSLGLILHEMLCGSLPQREMLEVVACHADLPQALQDSIAKATRSDPHDRYATVNELLAACEEAFANNPFPSNVLPTLSEGDIITGPQFQEPMRIESVKPGPNHYVLGLSGMQSEKFRRVTLYADDVQQITVLNTTATYAGDGTIVRLGLQAYALRIAYEFDPFFGLSISRVDPLPHQLTAVYDYLLKLPRIRFLLADDAGAGKTIMAGLLIRELKLRGILERILIVCPANLAFQWQREMGNKFDEKFFVLKGKDVREQYGINQWIEHDQVITSLDLAKREEIVKGLEQVHWDLVIVDEAHRMSWAASAPKTARYKLGELLRDTTDHYLMLTATPHKGDPVNFARFLQLLDQDAYADVHSVQQVMQEHSDEQKRMPCYLRRTKEAMVYFPERQPDGTWDATKIFTKRIPKTANFEIEGDEYALYKEVTTFIKNQSRQAAKSNDPRARAVGFRMTLYQRRLASSARALRQTLENSANRMCEQLEQARTLASQAPFSTIPDDEELEEMDEEEREEIQQFIVAITLASNPQDVQQEIDELCRFAARAKALEEAHTEAKLSKLKDVLHQEGFFDEPSKQLLIFTEFKDTLSYLVERLTEWGFKVGTIHGSMPTGSSENPEPNSRIFAERQFWQGKTQILVATEAAGEGINLHCCHIMFNYDIPWNPNRLEQRMGRIHRYGQKENCLIFNFVATNTIEGNVLNMLLQKLQTIRDALDDDAVFNVVGDVLPASHIEQVLRQYYAGELGDSDLEDRLLRDVDEEHFRNICQHALEGLAVKKLNLSMLVERRARARERRVVPETINRFIAEAAKHANLTIKSVTNKPHTFEPGRIPAKLHEYAQQSDWNLPPLAKTYPRCTTDRETADKHGLEWVIPSHPLFEALRRHMFALAQDLFAQGACYTALQYDWPVRIDFYHARIVDGMGQTVSTRLFVVELAEGREPCLQEPDVLGNCTPTTPPDQLPPIAMADEPTTWLDTYALQPFLKEQRAEHSEEIDRIFHYVDMSLRSLIQKADDDIGRIQEEVDQGIQGAEGRLAQAESRHDDLRRRQKQRFEELQRQRTLTLQGVERLTSVLVLPPPEDITSQVRHLRPSAETEAIAMREVIAYEEARGCQVEDVHTRNLGYDITSIDLTTGEIRLIEVKGLAYARGNILLTPNERRVAEDRPDCYWLYIVTNCSSKPKLEEPIPNPASFNWREVQKVQHYQMEVNALVKPMQVREERAEYNV